MLRISFVILPTWALFQTLSLSRDAVLSTDHSGGSPNASPSGPKRFCWSCWSCQAWPGSLVAGGARVGLMLSGKTGGAGKSMGGFEPIFQKSIASSNIDFLKSFGRWSTRYTRRVTHEASEGRQTSSGFLAWRFLLGC